MTLIRCSLLLPFMPMLIRLIQFVIYRKYMKRVLSETKMDADAHRAVAIGMAQFSFAGALALTIVNAKVEMNLALTAYYLFLSFILLLFVTNLQSYKYYEWTDLIGDAAYESGMLCLMLSLISVVSESELTSSSKYTVAGIALFVWSVDMVMRYTIRSSYWSAQLRVDRENLVPEPSSEKIEEKINVKQPRRKHKRK